MAVLIGILVGFFIAFLLNQYKRRLDSVQAVSADLEVRITNGLVLLRVRGENLGLVQTLELKANANNPFPWGYIDIINYNGCADRTVELLQSVPWLDLRVKNLNTTHPVESE